MTRFSFTLLVFFLDIAVTAQDSDYKNYPVPAPNENMLFYLQRNLNKNTLIYELNRLPGGEINPEQPVIIYWIRYEEGGTRKELSYIQQLVFGLNYKMLNKDSSIFLLNFKKHSSRDIYLVKDVNSSVYRAYIYINGEKSCLQRIFIQLKNSFFLKPEVKHIEISGISLNSNRLISERYLP